MNIAIICAMDKNRVIGQNGKMPWHIPDDLKNFKTITMGKPVIMGRKTFESIISFLGKPLPGRKNIVLTKTVIDNTKETNMKNWNNYPEVAVAADINSAIELAKQTGADEAIIAGGGQIYQAFLPLANKMYLSIIDGDYSGDTFFPEYNKANWQEIITEQKDKFIFKILENKSESNSKFKNKSEYK